MSSIPNEQHWGFLPSPQEWKRVHECMPESANSAAQHKREWAKAAQLSVEQLERVETEGPLAAKLLLASVERLLYKISMKYVRQVGFQFNDPYHILSCGELCLYTACTYLKRFSVVAIVWLLVTQGNVFFQFLSVDIANTKIHCRAQSWTMCWQKQGTFG